MPEHIDSMLLYTMNRILDKFYSQWWLFHSFCFSSWSRLDYSEVLPTIMVLLVEDLWLMYIFHKRFSDNACCSDSFLCNHFPECRDFMRQSLRRCLISTVVRPLDANFVKCPLVTISWTKDGFWGSWWFHPSIHLWEAFRVCNHRENQRDPFDFFFL